MDYVEIITKINNISSILVLIFIGILTIFRNSILLYISNSLNMELEKEKSDLNGKVLTNLEDHKKSIQKELDEYKHKLDSVLENQRLEHILLNTRYALIKKKKLACYIRIYGQLYKTLKYFKNYLSHKCFVKVGEGYDDHLICWIRESKMHPINQTKLIDAIKNKTKDAQKLYEYEEKMILYNVLSNTTNNLSDYFHVNKILINGTVGLKIEKLIDDIQFIILYLHPIMSDDDYVLTNIAFIQRFGYEYPKHKNTVIELIENRLTEIENNIIELLEKE